MNTKIKKQNPPKPEANSKLVILNFKLFAFFRFPFGAVTDPSTDERSAVAERSGHRAESRCRSVRLPAVIRNSSFVIFFRLPFLLFPFVLFLLTACPEPTPPDYGLSLEAVDIVCTEATFRVSAADTTATWDCGLYRDDSLMISQTITD
jgi:hypothetical protein